MRVFILIPAILDLEPWKPRDARNKRPSHGLSVFLEQTTDDKPVGILRATHPSAWFKSRLFDQGERVVLIKVRPPWVDSDLSDMPANTHPCKLPVTDPNLAVFNISNNSSAAISLGLAALRKVRAGCRGFGRALSEA